MNTTFWIQFLGVIFGAAMLYFTFVKYKRNEISNSERLMWSLGWVLIMVIAMFPQSLDPIIGSLNFYRRLDFFVVFGFFTLLGLGFYNYSIMKKIEKKIELFVRKRALEQRPHHQINAQDALHPNREKGKGEAEEE